MVASFLLLSWRIARLQLTCIYRQGLCKRQSIAGGRLVATEVWDLREIEVAGRREDSLRGLGISVADNDEFDFGRCCRR